MILVGHGMTLHFSRGRYVQQKLKFKVLASHRSGAVAALEGAKDVTVHMDRVVCDMFETGFWCVRRQLKWLCRTVLSGQGKSRRFRETRPGTHMAVWVTVKQPSLVQRCFKCTLTTTATVASFLWSC